LRAILPAAAASQALYFFKQSPTGLRRLRAEGTQAGFRKESPIPLDSSSPILRKTAHKKIQSPLSDWILWSILVGTE